jgi:hypothetical protein
MECSRLLEVDLQGLNAANTCVAFGGDMFSATVLALKDQSNT